MKICKRKIDDANTYSVFSVIITKPFRSVFFKFTEKHVSDKEAACFLKDLWVATETVNIDQNVTRKNYVKYFRKYAKELLMDEEKLEIYSSFNDEVVIYRGINNITNHPVDGMSWTPDFESALFFAERFGEGGQVFEAKIKKEDILAYFHCGEKETVVDYRKLQDVKLFKKIN